MSAPDRGTAVQPRARRWTWVSALALGVLFLATLAVRQTGIACLLPSLLESDSNIVFQVQQLEQPELESDSGWQLGSYPLTIAAAVALCGAPARPPRALDTKEDWLSLAAWPSLRVRRAVCLWTTAAVPLTYLVARSFLTPAWSFAAAALCASSLLFTSFAQQARPHGPLAASVLLLVWAALGYAARPRLWRLGALGLALGLCVATLHSGIAALLPAWVAVGLAQARRGRRAGARLWLIACAGLAVLCSYHGLFSMDTSQGGIQLRSFGLRQGEHEIGLRQLSGRGIERFAQALYRYELPALILFALGALGALRARRRGPPAAATVDAVRVAAAFAAPYQLVLCLFEGTAERFLLPWLPFIYIASLIGLRQLFSGGLRRMAALLAFAAVAANGVLSTRLLQARAQPTTLEQCAAWLEEHAEDGARVLANPGLELPIFSTPQALAARLERLGPGYPYISQWTRFEARARLEGALPAPVGAKQFDFGLFVPRDLEPAPPAQFPAALAARGPLWLVLDSDDA